MTTSSRRSKCKSSTSSSKTSDHPLQNANRADVVAKLKRALNAAQAGETNGAMLVWLNKEKEWTVSLAGKLRYDEDTVCLIASRIFGACITGERNGL